MKEDFSCRLLHVLHEHLYTHPSRICPKSENDRTVFLPHYLQFGMLIPPVSEFAELLLSAGLWEAG